MEITRDELAQRYSALDDDSLAELYRRGTLTPLANEALQAELLARDITLPAPPPATVAQAPATAPDEAAAGYAFRSKIRKILIVSNVVYGILLPVSVPFAMFSAMLAAGRLTLATRIAIYSLLSAPLVLLFSIFAPWICYRLRMYRTALALLIPPVISGVLIMLYIVIPEMRA